MKIRFVLQLLLPLTLLLLTILTAGIHRPQSPARIPASDFDMDLTFRKLSKYAANTRAPSSDAPKPLDVQTVLIESAVLDLALRQILSSSQYVSVGCSLGQRSDVSCVVGVSVDFD